MRLEEKLFSTKNIYNGKVLQLNMETVELPNGRLIEREVIKHPGAVAVIAFKSEDTILLVEQYRSAIGRVLLELPAGKIEPQEGIEKCAVRELEEETGYKSDKLQYLGKIVTAPGYCNEIIYFYKAENLYEGNIGGDEDEFINVHQVKIEKIMEMIKNGEIIDGKTIAALMLL